MQRIRFSVLAASLIFAVLAASACTPRTKPIESSSISEEGTSDTTVETTTVSTTTPTTLPSTEPTTLEKSVETSQSISLTTTDEEENHVTAESADDIMLKELLSDADKADQYDQLLKVYENYHLNNAETDDSDPFRNEYIRIFIDSEDAETLALALDEITEQYNAIRKENTEKIKGDSIGFSWAGFTLERVVDTEDVLGFMTCKANWIVPGPAFLVIDAYNFDTEDGHLLADAEVLDTIGMDYDKLNAFLGESLSGKKIERGGESLEPEIVTTLEEAKEQFSTGETDGKILIRVKPEQGILLDGDKIYVVIEAYLAMDDTFSFLEIQEMSLERSH